MSELTRIERSELESIIAGAEMNRMPMEAKYGKSIEPQKHRKVYDFIEQYQKDHGTSPHLQLIADGCGIARATISNHIKVMEKNGIPVSRRNTNGNPIES
jgi:DNA-binding MarR family transcriptional regulator